MQAHILSHTHTHENPHTHTAYCYMAIKKHDFFFGIKGIILFFALVYMLKAKLLHETQTRVTIGFSHFSDFV